MTWTTWVWVWGAIVVAVELLGVLMAVDAIMRGRSAQGAVAWGLSLVIFPWLALPLYIVFGQRKFYGYVDARRSGDLEINDIAVRLQEHAPAFEAALDDERPALRVMAHMAKMPFTNQNDATLLVDGGATFDAIFDQIARANDYVLVQKYILRDDGLGRRFKAALIDRARAGIRVYLLFDEIGCSELPNTYLSDLREGGVDAQPFKTARGLRNRFRLNFRNHRKIVIVDGTVAIVGGLNVGDEYAGEDDKLGAWRDTSVMLQGPAVQCVQLSFLEDWYWAMRQVPELNWLPRPVEQVDRRALVLPTGPADDIESCGLFFVQAIESARERLWIGTPYFVPDASVVSALQLAAMRGVDVRIMLPHKADHPIVQLAAYSFLEETVPAGVKLYRYQPGFMHQKVMLIDDDVATVGTANMDNRSFRLNFELTIVIADADFSGQVQRMLEHDLSQSRLFKVEHLAHRSIFFKFAVRFARLLAPVL